MAGEAPLIADLEACPQCGAPSRRLDVSVQEREDSVVVQVSCRRCGHEISEVITLPQTESDQKPKAG
jgi:uncharacterized Zn finger protein